jgi:hypothetical protein
MIFSSSLTAVLYEKLKRATSLDHLLLVTTEIESDHSKVIDR